MDCTLHAPPKVELLAMEDALFDFGETKREIKDPNRSATAEQIEQIRSAFETARITGQTERKALIQSVVKREIPSLRDLFEHEVTGVIYRINDAIHAVQQLGSQQRSAWDDREEDTWIDKL